MTSTDGLVVIDKPTGWTSHDVVGRIRRLAGTRKVGHAGTLDPMATGVLVLGLGRATRLLGYLAATDKSYDATIRLGERTVTDDAEGDLEGGATAAHVVLEQVVAELGKFVGEIQQVPSKVSAVKVAGERAYKRVRDGQTVELAPRAVTISRCDVLGHRRPTPELLDVDITVTCSSGTYVRAIARDVGEALGVGGHLTALRRTRVGMFSLDQAKSLAECEVHLEPIPLGRAVSTSFPSLIVDDETAAAVGFGRPIPIPDRTSVGPIGVFDGQGTVLALMAPKDGLLRVVVGLTG